MAEERYKPAAKCMFYKECALYNAGVLRQDLEITLCGKGHVIDPGYLPRILETYTPPTQEAAIPWEGAVCPAFSGKVDALFTRAVRACLEKVDWFWEGKRGLDDLMQT